MVTDAQVQQLKALVATIDADETAMDNAVSAQVQTAAALNSAVAADDQAQLDVTNAQAQVQADTQAIKDFVNSL